MSTVVQLYRQSVERLTAISPTPQLDSGLIMANYLGWRDYQLITRRDMPLKTVDQQAIEHLVSRRQAGEPVAYIIGQRDFMGLTFTVNRHVLIPRPDSELLVERVITDVADQTVNGLDLATGSGALAIAILVHCPHVAMTASDISEQALQVAVQNSERNGVDTRLTTVRSDIFDNITACKPYDFIVSNPPYIAHSKLAELMIDVRDYEPALALDGGEDGLYFYRQIIPRAHSRLRPKGMIYLEIGSDQASDVVQLLRDNDYYLIDVLRDLAGHDRVVCAVKE